MINELLTFGSKNIFSKKLFSLINIIGSAIGITSVFFISIWVINEFSFDKNIPNFRNIYLLSWSNKDGTSVWNGSPYGLGASAIKNIPEISAATKFMNADADHLILHINKQTYFAENAVFVDSNWFSLFHYELKQGTLENFNHFKNGVILSESISKKYFGILDPIGKTITIDSGIYLVSAVIKDPGTNNSFKFDIFLPVELHYKNAAEQNSSNSWKIFDWYTFVETHANTSTSAIQNKLFSVISQMNKDVNLSKLIRLDEIHFNNDVQIPGSHHGSRMTVFIFLTLGTLIILISSINYVNFVTAGASQRLKEISVKKIFGASKHSLFWQFFIESFLTNFLALSISIILILCLFRQFTNFVGYRFPLLSIPMWLELFGLFGVTTILMGVYPSVLLSSMNLLSLTGNKYANLKGGSLRKFLLTFQFVASISLFAAVVTMFSQLKFMNFDGVTFNRSETVAIPINSAVLKNLDSKEKQSLIDFLRNKLLLNSNIENVTVSSESIINLNLSMAGIASWIGKKPGFDPIVYPFMVDPDFNSVFRLKVIEGRWFNKAFVTDRHNYILNETSVEDFGLLKPYIGQPFAIFGDTGKIIGIVKDFHFRNFYEKIAPLVLMDRPGSGNVFFVKIRASNTKTTLSQIENIWRSMFPQIPFEFQFLDESFDQLYRAELKSYALVFYFSIIAILLTSMGLLGLVTFTLEKKVKEIGIRKVLGSSVKNIVFLLSNEFIKLLFIASLVALPLSWWAMNKWLQGFEYRVSITPLTLLLSLIPATFITFLVIGFKTIDAARENPIKSLRVD